MDSLAALKKALELAGHETISFKGYELISTAGRFTMAMDTIYHNNKPLTKPELKEVINGEPQARQSKEPEGRMPDVQASQSERSKTRKTRKSGA